MIDLANMPNSNPAHVKAWMNVLLHEQLDDVEIKPQLVATLFTITIFFIGKKKLKFSLLCLVL